ncbi:MAG: hypothetical protein GY769_02215 [bacterium]|nr:hypothetical protein [bacterium]
MVTFNHKLGAGLLALSLGFLILPGGSAEAAKKKLIFDLSDPRGDDFGGGSLVYPLRREFERGDLDLVRLRAFGETGATRFEATFAKPIRIAGGEAVDDLGTQLDSIARHGFYTFNVDIYIDRDRQESSGATAMMPGRKAVVRSEDAWDRAVVLTPRPSLAQGTLKRQVLRTMEKEMARDEEVAIEAEMADLKRSVPEDLSERVYFPNRIRVQGNRISFVVPDSFLGGKAQADWSYVVAVSGSDLVVSTDLAASVGLAEPTRNNLMILPVGPGTWQSRFGGGREGQTLQPPLIDIMVPGGMSQERVLSDFSTKNNRPAELPGVNPADESGP